MTKPKKEQIEISEMLDKQLLSILRDGRPLIGPDGLPVYGKDGKQIYVPPSASDMNIARQRLRDLGIDKMPVGEDDASSLRDEFLRQDARVRNFKMPAIADSREDDAATA